MAVRREDFSLRAGCTAFLPHAVLPIFSRDDAEPGGPKFWLERRYWEHAILAKDQLIDFRKQELKRGILQRLVQEYELSDFDFLFPERRHDPLLSTSRGLMLWLGERWMMAARKGGQARLALAARWKRSTSNLFAGATAACASIEDRPGISFSGVDLRLGVDGRLGCAQICGVWPTFEAEWGQIADMPEGPIPRLSEDKRPLLEQLFWFFLIRTKWTDEAMPRQHPVMLLRHTVIQASAWLMEVHIHLRIVTDQHRRTAVVPTALTGPGGGRVKKCPVARLRCLEKIVHSFGSDQVTVSALGHRRGSAAIMRGIRNRMYQDVAQSHCCIRGPISVNWDGGTHGGNEVIVGSLSNIASGSAFYLRPQVMLGM